MYNLGSEVKFPFAKLTPVDPTVNVEEPADFPNIRHTLVCANSAANISLFYILKMEKEKENLRNKEAMIASIAAEIMRQVASRNSVQVYGFAQSPAGPDSYLLEQIETVVYGLSDRSSKTAMIRNEAAASSEKVETTIEMSLSTTCSIILSNAKSPNFIPAGTVWMLDEEYKFAIMATCGCSDYPLVDLIKDQSVYQKEFIKCLHVNFPWMLQIPENKKKSLVNVTENTIPLDYVLKFFPSQPISVVVLQASGEDEKDLPDDIMAGYLQLFSIVKEHEEGHRDIQVARKTTS